MSATNTVYRLIPEDEGRCIWMTTGLISYKLCARNYQCETCPFDQALTNATRSDEDLQESENDWAEESPKMDSFTPVDSAVFYHPGHCWVRVEKPEEVRIGIDDFLARLITAVKVISLPPVGRFTQQGLHCAHIIQKDYILQVVSPLSGLIQTVNERLKTEPELLTNDPIGEGWLITIKPENLETELDGLLFGRKAVLWFQQQEKEIITRIDRMLKDNQQAVGPTMHDGGVRISRLQDLLNVFNSRQRTRLLDFSVRSATYSPRMLFGPTG